MSNIEIARRIGEMEATSQQLYLLAYTNAYFVPADITIDEENIHFSFVAGGLIHAETLKSEQWQKLLFLYNAFVLEEVYEVFNFSLSPYNLMCDINSVPQILVRDVIGAERPSFTAQYLALCGSLLGKHSFEDYLLSGDGLYKKTPLLKK